MQYRMLGRTGFRVSTVSFGAWAIGGTWGDVNDDESLRALHHAVDRGVNFFDTADVYGDGRSERLLGRLRRERARDNLIITTKAGKRQAPLEGNTFSRANLTAFVERSLQNLQVEALDLLQLHCPPTDVLYRPEVFGVMDDLVAAGKIRCYGVSVERVEEALKAIDFPGVQTIQIVYNIVRQRPSELFFPEAKRRQVGILARLPLASGLLAGKMTAATQFGADDHRNYNRHGQAFDVGETFAGLDFERGLAFVEHLRALVPAGVSLASFAIRWILMQDAVTCAIPGAKRESQVDDNVSAADAPPIPEDLMAKVKALYDAEVKALVHQRW